MFNCWAHIISRETLPQHQLETNLVEAHSILSPALWASGIHASATQTHIQHMVQAAGLDILNAFPETVPLWSFHMWDKDCTHYCMPGPYELWTYMLTQKLKNTTFRD